MVAKNSFVFTNKALEKLSIPVIKRSYYYDTTTRGLALYVTATGVKKFFVYRRVHGRPERIIIGRIIEVTLEQAREKAQVINAQIADGKNPQAARRAIRQDITLGELWTLYLERHAKVPSALATPCVIATRPPSSVCLNSSFNSSTVCVCI
jgi:hypothetical protein